MDYTISDRSKRYLLPFAQRLEFLVPTIRNDLKAARIHIDHRNYLAFCLQKGLQAGLAVSVSLTAVGFMLGEDFLQLLGPATLLLAPLVFLSLAYRPRIQANKKARKIEKELPYALRHMLIQIKSDISLYKAMVSVTEDYGEASKEFQTIVNEINGGKSQLQALEDSLSRNNSLMYRKTIWQMINALKSGTDMGETLQTLVDNMVEDQRIQVEKYGKDLNPFILMYLMLGVIVPSLGVTIMIVLSSFTGFSVDIYMFGALTAGLFIFNLAFLNLIQQKRPEVKAA